MQTIQPPQATTDSPIEDALPKSCWNCSNCRVHLFGGHQGLNVSAFCLLSNHYHQVVLDLDQLEEEYGKISITAMRGFEAGSTCSFHDDANADLTLIKWAILDSKLGDNCVNKDIIFLSAFLNVLQQANHPNAPWNQQEDEYAQYPF